MPVRALLLDLDGTLVDTNDAHTDAWLASFAAHGYHVERTAVARMIGMGGDKLVPHLLGEAAEARNGEALRTVQGERFQALTAERGVPFFEGAEALIAAARGRGVHTAICTSGSKDNLDALFANAPADLRAQVDLVTTADDVDESKPDPDVLHVALNTLDVAPDEALLAGDTRYDLEAAQRALIPFVGITTWVWTAEDFRARGARDTVASPAELVQRLDDVVGMGASRR